MSRSRQQPEGVAVRLPAMRFRSAVATNWLRGLLGILGALELLMAMSAASAFTVAAGLLAGSALIAAATMSSPRRRTMVVVLVAATLPFTILTWWTIVTPLLTVAALAIGLGITAPHRRQKRPTTQTATGLVT